MVNYANANPYLAVVDMNPLMRGTGAPRSTVFGAIGRTQMDPYQKSLGGLIEKTTRGKLDKPVEAASKIHLNTDHHLIGPAAKTRVSGEHYGMTPYAGAYRGPLGPRL